MRVKKKVHIFLFVMVIGILTMAGCRENTAATLSGDEAKEALSHADKLYFTGDLDDVNNFSDILADGQVAGYVEESGIFDPRTYIYLDGEKAFYIKYVTDKPINQVDAVTSTTYGYYDMQDQCLGYAQLRLLEDNEYYFVFLDAEGKRKDYYADEDTKIIYNADKEQIGTVTAEIESYFAKLFHIEIDTTGSDTEVAFMDKMVLYSRNAFLLDDLCDGE